MRWLTRGQQRSAVGIAACSLNSYINTSMNRNQKPNINWDPANPPKQLLADEMALALELLKDTLTPDMKAVPAHLITLGIKLGDAAVVRKCMLLLTIDERRHEMMRGIGAEYAKECMPIAAVFIVPTWVSTQTGAQIKKKGYTRPSLDPERTEGVLVSGALFNKKTVTVMLPAYRAEDGCVRIAWGEAMTYLDDSNPIILYRFFEGAALTLKDYKPKQTNE